MKAEEIQKQLNELKGLLIRNEEAPLSLSEAANHLSISKSYLYKLTAQNKIPHYKPQGKLIYFNRVELNEWVYRKSRQKLVDHANWRASSRQEDLSRHGGQVNSHRVTGDGNQDEEEDEEGDRSKETGDRRKKQ